MQNMQGMVSPGILKSVVVLPGTRNSISTQTTKQTAQKAEKQQRRNDDERSRNRKINLRFENSP